MGQKTNLVSQYDQVTGMQILESCVFLHFFSQRWRDNPIEKSIRCTPTDQKISLSPSFKKGTQLI